MGSAVYFSRRVFTENLARDGRRSWEGTRPAPASQPWHTRGFSTRAKHFSSCWLPLPAVGRGRRAGLWLSDPRVPASPRTPRGGRCSPLCKWPGRANKGPLPPRPCAGGDGFPFRPAARAQGTATPRTRIPPSPAGQGGTGQVFARGDRPVCGTQLPVGIPGTAGGGCLIVPVRSGGASWHSSESWRHPGGDPEGLRVMTTGSLHAPCHGKEIHQVPM